MQQRFMQLCEEQATQGNCEADLEEDVPNLICSMWDSALRLLKEWLGTLGFDSHSADHDAWQDTVTIWAAWSMAKEGKDLPEPTLPRGIKGHCPICHEIRHLVALVPCGHSVCKKCHQGGQLRQCPMCRTNLTGATRALFVE